MFVIVKIGDSAGFIHTENGNIIITPNIQEADKFKEDNEVCRKLLETVRVRFPEFRFVVADCPCTIFGNKPRFVRWFNGFKFYIITLYFLMFCT